MRPADSASGIFRNLDPDLCVQGRRILEIITGCSECLSFPHCQYTASLDLDTFPEIFRSAIIGKYDFEKGLLFSLDIYKNSLTETIISNIQKYMFYEEVMIKQVLYYILIWAQLLKTNDVVS